MGSHGAPADVILALLEAGKLAAKTRKHGLFPLHIALSNATPADVTLQVLRAHPAAARQRPGNHAAYHGGPKLLTHTDQLPLHIALRHNAPEQVVLAVLREFPKATREKDGGWIDGPKDQLALHVALRHNTPEATTLAVLRENPEAAQRKSSGLLPLHLALKNRVPARVILDVLAVYPTAARKLFPRCRWRLSSLLPLHAVLHDSLAPHVVMAVLQAYPQAANMTTSEGELPLHLALGAGASLETVEALVQAYPEGLRGTEALVCIADSFASSGGRTGLSQVVRHGITMLDSYDAAVEATHADAAPHLRTPDRREVLSVLHAWNRGSLLWGYFIERSLQQIIEDTLARLIRTFLCGMRLRYPWHLQHASMPRHAQHIP